MPESFDPYHKWLAIPPEEQPPTLYRLLGTAMFESDPDVISHAADQRMAHVRSFQTGKHANLSQRILSEIAQAKICLLDETKKAAYDDSLRLQKQQEPTIATAKPLPTQSPATKSRAVTPSIAIDTNRSTSGTPRVQRSRQRSLMPIVAACVLISVIALVGVVIALNLPGNGEVAPAEKASAELPPEQDRDPHQARQDPLIPNDSSLPNEEVGVVPPKPDVVASPLPPTDQLTIDDSASTDTMTNDTSTLDSELEGPIPVTDPKPVDPAIPQEVAKKRRLPDLETQSEVQEQIKDLFESEIAAAESPKEKCELAKSLLEYGKNTKNDPNARYILFRMAAAIAVNIGETEMAMSAIDTMAAEYQVDVWKMRIAALDGVGNLRGSDFKERNERLADVAQSLLKQALAAGEFDAVDDLLKVALSAARKSSNVSLVKAVVARKNEVDELLAAYANAKKALGQLAENPDDPEANLTIGRFLCFVRNDWGAGLLHLAKAKEFDLAAVAKLELAAPSSPEQQIELGDAWSSIVDSYDGAIKEGIQNHAATWYLTALPQLSGLEKKRVEGKLALLREDLTLADNRPEFPSDRVRQVPAPIRSFDPSRVEFLRSLSGHTEAIYCIDVSPNGTVLASGGFDDVIILWDLRTGGKVATLKGHQDDVLSLKFFPDGKTLASGSKDHTIRLWDLESMTVRETIEAHPHDVSCLAVSADGRILVSGSGDRTIKIWAADSLRLLQTLEGHTSYVHAVEISPDGKEIASASADRTIRIWNLRTGETLGVLHGHGEQVRCIAFSPDGKKLVSGSLDRTLKLWDVESHEQLQTLTGHEHWVVATACSPNGTLVASASVDKTVRLWDPQTGRELRVLSGHTSRPECLAFAGNGKYLISAGYDKTIRIWGEK